MFVIELEEKQLQILLGMIDATLKSTGIQSLKDAHNILEVLEKAVKKDG